MIESETSVIRFVYWIPCSRLVYTLTKGVVIRLVLEYQTLVVV